MRGVALPVALAVSSAVNTQLAAPVVAWLAVLAMVASARPRARPLRLVAPPLATVVLATIVAVPLGVALTWPSPGLAEDPEAVLSRAEAASRRAGGDDAALADASGGAWRATGLRPRWGRAWRSVGSISLERAAVRREAALAEDAAAAFRNAREVNPLDVWAALGEGQACRLLGEVGAAGAAFQVAVRIEPNCVPCWLELAVLGAEAGDVEAARAALAEAEQAEALSRRSTFVSAYERRLAETNPAAVARLRAILGGASR
jgi:tetratricopeptide (TPR) repeat protein